MARLSVISNEPFGFRDPSPRTFIRMLCLERKRTERSGRRFVLMLLKLGALLRAGDQVMAKLMDAPAIQRDTDCGDGTRRNSNRRDLYRSGQERGKIVFALRLPK